MDKESDDMSRTPFAMPYPDAYKALTREVYEYYWLCFPLMDDEELHKLVRLSLLGVEDAVRRVSKRKDKQP